MSLRIRRGLAVNRVTIIPEEGEFLYDTDTLLVYIGDGVTLGGNPVDSGGAAVLTVVGTANRITSSGGANPIIDIAATYVGQASITTLGTIGTGTWQGTIIGPTYGGTGINNAARTITINTTSGIFDFLGAFTLTVAGNSSISGTTSGTNTGDQALANTQIAFGSVGNVVTSSADLTWDDVGKVLTANGKLTVTGAIDPTHLYLDEQAGDPANVANKGILYTKDVAGVTQLFYEASDATVIALTPLTGGSVTSVSGTANRITSTGGATPIIDIDAAYVGQASITTLGTIGTGTWQGTVLSPTYGGTGINNAARTLTISSNSGTLLFSGVGTTLTIGAAASVSGSNTGDQTIASLSPLTTKGDLFTFSTVNDRLAVGATDGQMLQVSAAAATGLAYSTPTYPSASGTAGKILRSDGTNNIYSTFTIPTSFSTGDILYSAASSVLTALGGAGAGNALLSGPAPSWGKIALTTHVSGVLPIANGGSNKALTLVNGGVLWTDADSFEVTAAGSAGQVLQSNGAAAPTWSVPTYPASSGTTGKVLRSDGTNNVYSTFTIPDTYTTGDIIQATAANVFSVLPAVATGNALISGGVGTASSWGKIALATHISGTLPIPNGGTGNTTIAIDKMWYSSATDTLSETPFQEIAEQTLGTTPVWTFSTSAPTGATTHVYTWFRINHQVCLKIWLKYATPGSGCTVVNIPLPGDCPAPRDPTGLGAASDKLYAGTGWIDSALGGSPPACRIWLGVDSGDTGWQVNAIVASNASRVAHLNVWYDCA